MSKDGSDNTEVPFYGKTPLLGNEAIAQAIVAAGCQVATAYPGTPSSEILPFVASTADRLGAAMAIEWGANEKVAFEMAVGASFAGARACVVMKQVGLNVAADSFMTAAYYRLKGGLMLVSADDPGPHSSQNEQDSRMFAMFAKVPCLDPSDAVEAGEMVYDAFALSEKHEIIVMLRPTTRVSHCRQAIEPVSSVKPGLPVKFERDVSRWVALPVTVKKNHPLHNLRIEEIREEFETSRYNYEVKGGGEAKLGVICSGVSFATLKDITRGRTDVDILRIGTPYPLPHKLVNSFIDRHEKVLVLEETYPVIETQLMNRERVSGRWDGVVPSAGELLPEVIEGIVLPLLHERPSAADSSELDAAMKELGIEPRKPQLCAGCPHRASYFAIRKAFPNGIAPSDIGCYSLAVNQNGIDSSLCMGASVTMSSGFHIAHAVSGQERPIIATLGDSTFFHMGIPGLVSAVYNRHSFVLCVLDNRVTAMTGGQSNPGLSGKVRKGDEGSAVSIEAVARGCGVKFVEAVDAYDVAAGADAVTRAWESAKANRTPAVVIFRHPCMLLRVPQSVVPVKVDAERCVGCRLCITNFGCPGLTFDAAKKKAEVDRRGCVSCGVCRVVCPRGAIVEAA
ncbi:MAG: indolepyruvate ferredoxin oxidoreductase subunit alpha [Synergistaceae bacterium]|jgi:indolepyruvate ferredoxin oxidoreductase alpha subunit|nr:indolepyruvate ferredoxin oxidoreductase subunit alpha [Synergistaceae bacterium]